MLRILILAVCGLALAAPAFAATVMNRHNTTESSPKDYGPSRQIRMEPDPAERRPPDLTPQKDLLLKAQATLESLLSDPDYPSLLELVTRAKAVLIVPRLVKVSIFLGGHGGSGVLLARDATGKWSYPAFYTLGGINYGLQLGAQTSELILTIMSEEGLKTLLDHELTLGADAGASLGNIGRGVRAATGLGADADIYAFARSAGLYVGVSLDGTAVAPDPSWNRALYGPRATPEDILVRHLYASPYADSLVGAMP